MEDKNKTNTPTWKIVVALAGITFFTLYGVISFYIDIYNLIFKR